MSKFNTILENFINRGSNKGFAIRDIVKFVKNYKSDDFYKESSDDFKQSIDEFAKSDKNIRVINIRPGQTIPGNSVTNNNSRGCCVMLDIAIEYAPHRTNNGMSISIPSSMVEVVWSDVPNLNAQPSAFDKEYEQYTKKFEGVDRKQYRRQAEVNGKLTDINDTLPTKNTTLSNSNNGKVGSNIVSDSKHYNEVPLMESYVEELEK